MWVILPGIRYDKLEWQTDMAWKKTGSKRERVKSWKRQCQECQICGYRPIGIHKLQAHHIIPRKDGGEDGRGNLIFLCETCHFTTHREEWYENLEIRRMRSQVREVGK